jgi:hypothetical protein
MESGDDFIVGDIYVVKDGVAVKPWGKREQCGVFLLHVECQYSGYFINSVKKGESLDGKVISYDSHRG